MQSQTTNFGQAALTGAVPSTIHSPNHQPIEPQSGEPLPNSRRVWVPGKIHPDIRVPFREINLSPTKSFNGQLEANAPVCVYDCSGPWGDPAFAGHVEQGLPPLRRTWILARGDVEQSASSYKPIPGRSDAAIPPTLRRTPLRAKAGQAVTQLRYARQGIITPEMEFIAIRENLGRESLESKVSGLKSGHRELGGESFGAKMPDHITPEFVRSKWPGAARSSRPTSTTRRVSR